MQMTDHTFPLPETVAHQLEEIEHELQNRPLTQKISEFVHINRWSLVALAGLAGIATGIYFTGFRR
jgi:hypothetical protein